MYYLITSLPKPITKSSFIDTIQPLLPLKFAWQLKETNETTLPNGRKDRSATYKASIKEIPKDSEFLFQTTLSGLKILNESYSFNIPQEWKMQRNQFLSIITPLKNLSFFSQAAIILVLIVVCFYFLSNHGFKHFILVSSIIMIFQCIFNAFNYPSVLYHLPTIGNHTSNLITSIAFIGLGITVTSIFKGAFFITSMNEAYHTNKPVNYSYYLIGSLIGLGSYALVEIISCIYNIPKLELPWINTFNSSSITISALMHAISYGLFPLLWVVLITLRKK